MLHKRCTGNQVFHFLCGGGHQLQEVVCSFVKPHSINHQGPAQSCCCLLETKICRSRTGDSEKIVQSLEIPEEEETQGVKEIPLLVDKR